MDKYFQRKSFDHGNIFREAKTVVKCKSLEAPFDRKIFGPLGLNTLCRS